MLTDGVSDFTSRVELTQLAANTAYHYRVWFSDAGVITDDRRSQHLTGTLRTAPDPSASRPVSFVVSGDLGGGRDLCLDVEHGYRIFARMQELAPDFFVANGDMIYADRDCPGSKPGREPDPARGYLPEDFPRIDDPSVDWMDVEQVRAIYLQHWRQNRADTSFSRFLQHVPMYVQWDDHEVINDFGARWAYPSKKFRRRAGYRNLVEAGREAFFLYAPLKRHATEPERIYRSFRWGEALELFILDTRSYRDRNDLPDTPENEKTLLGLEQLRWLKRGLAQSMATWKVVSMGIPLSVPTTPNAAKVGRDGWANGTDPDFSAQTGFERELLDLVAHLDRANVDNVVFLATDVHFAATIRYELDADGNGDRLSFHELITGPLSARGLRRTTQARLDPTLNPVLLYAEGKRLNFGYIRIQLDDDGKARFTADVRGEDGAPRKGSELRLSPQ